MHSTAIVPVPARSRRSRAILAGMTVIATVAALFAATPAQADLGDPPLPAAPSASAPPPAILYQAYSHQLTDLGTPLAAAADITVY